MLQPYSMSLRSEACKMLHGKPLLCEKRETTSSSVGFHYISLSDSGRKKWGTGWLPSSWHVLLGQEAWAYAMTCDDMEEGLWTSPPAGAAHGSHGSSWGEGSFKRPSVVSTGQKVFKTRISRQISLLYFKKPITTVLATKVTRSQFYVAAWVMYIFLFTIETNCRLTKMTSDTVCPSWPRSY